MGVNFATSLNMGGELRQELCIIIFINAISGQILHIKYTKFIQNNGILNKKRKIMLY